MVLLCGGALLLAVLVYRSGADSLAAALGHVAWWQFALICLLQAVALTVDAWGWQLTLARDRVSLARLLAARTAGDAVNVLTAVASVGGEAVKAWVLRHEIPYAESVPSLILSKTAEVVAQVLLLVVAVVLAAASTQVPSSLAGALRYLLLVEAIGAGGLVAVQVAGLVGRGRRLCSWAGIDGRRVEQLDAALRRFYREDRRRFLAAVGIHLIGWSIGVVEAWFILASLGLPASLIVATVVEALWSAVRFATFFVPASLGPLEGANVAAFGVLGFGASAGLAFTLVRRARQAVWIGVGVVVLVAIRPTRQRMATEDSPRAQRAVERSERRVGDPGGLRPTGARGGASR